MGERINLACGQPQFSPLAPHGQALNTVLGIAPSTVYGSNTPQIENTAKEVGMAPRKGKGAGGMLLTQCHRGLPAPGPVPPVCLPPLTLALCAPTVLDADPGHNHPNTRWLLHAHIHLG